jgi:hypothetical protein
MIDACRGRNDERGALAEFLAAEGDLDLTSNTYVLGQAPLFHTILNQQFGYAGDSIAWVASARNNAVNEALCFSVEMNVRAPVGCLRVERKKGKSCKITPGFFLPTLWDALLWMIWQDESNGWPPPACRECHRIFPRSSAHERKYCSGVCAHRVTNREWRRKDLLQRKNTRKSIEAGGKHGPGKAR